MKQGNKVFDDSVDIDQHFSSHKCVFIKYC